MGRLRGYIPREAVGTGNWEDIKNRGVVEEQRENLDFGDKMD